MSANANIQINIEGDVFVAIKELKQQFNTLNNTVDKLESSTKNSFKSIKDSLGALNVVAITQQFENFKNTLDGLSQSGMSYESQMADLSAITGISGDKLKELGDKARENAKIFGGSASDSVETYKLLLSQLTPELANQPKILDEMAKSVSILSKTMKGDTSGAVEVLTTAMNQYGVSMDNPIKAQEELSLMMNAMSAGAKEGSAELPALKSAIQNVGGDAKRGGLAFEEMVSAIELLDKAGKKGAEGGTALRNVLSTLSQGRFLPKDVQDELRKAGVDITKLSDKSIGFTDRLRELNKVSGDSALITKLFGKENQLSASALIESVNAQDKMTEAITGTSTAQEQATIIMGTTAEKMSRLGAFFDDLKISLFSYTNSVTPFLSVIVGGVQSLSALAPALTFLHSIKKAITKEWIKSTALKIKDIAINVALKASMLAQAGWIGIVTVAQWAWNVAMTANPIGMIIVGIGALIAGIAWLTDGFSGFGEFFTAFWENITEWFGGIVEFYNTYLNPFSWLIDLIDYVFPGAKKAIFEFFGELWTGVYELFVQPFIDAWNWIADALGFGGNAPEINGEVKHTVSTEGGTTKTFGAQVEENKANE